MRHRTVAILLALTTLVPLAVAPVVAWAKGPTTWHRSSRRRSSRHFWVPTRNVE